MIKMIAFVKRKQGMTQEEFATYWTEEHVKLSVPLGMKGYRINIALEPQPMGNNPPHYDGTAEIWWADLESMQAALESTQNELAADDVNNFADVLQFVYTEEHVIV
ncbi:MAG: EthD family reductase [Chloroflexota bacterium]